MENFQKEKNNLFESEKIPWGWYLPEDAEIIRQQKKFLENKFSLAVMDCFEENKYIKANEARIALAEEVFKGIDAKERERHILFHVVFYSTIDDSAPFQNKKIFSDVVRSEEKEGMFVYDEKDEQLEELMEKYAGDLEKLKQFLKDHKI